MKKRQNNDKNLTNAKKLANTSFKSGCPVGIQDEIKKVRKEWRE